MKNIFIDKSFLIFIILILLFGFLIWSEIVSAEDFGEISKEEIKEYLELPKNNAQKLIESLTKILTSQDMILLSSENPDARETAVIVTLRKSVKIDVLNHLLIDAPVEIIGKIIKLSVEIARLFSAKDFSYIIKRFEEESVKKAVEEGMNALFENEIRITPGALKYSYVSYKGNKQEVIFQYLIIYKSLDAKRGQAEIRFYSPNTIEPPRSQGWFLTGTYHELKGDLPPFIVEISGLVENFGWVGTPSFKITFPESVPDLGIRPLSFLERNIVKPWQNEINKARLVLRKIFGRTTETAENITNWIGDTFKSLQNRVSQLGAQISVFLDFWNLKSRAEKESEIKNTKSELEEIKRQVFSLEEKLKNEEELRDDLKTKYESELSEINESVADLSETIDFFEEQMVGLTQLSVETKPEEKKESEEKVEEKIGETEIVLCQRKTADFPRRNKVIFNEIAWMGTENSSNDEWIELKNISGAEINLADWQILDKDGQIKIIFSSGEQFSANGFYLLERTDDNSVPNVLANKIYTGVLNDTNEALYLFNKNCELEDEVISNPDWPAGNKSSKRTMERKSNLSWQDSSNIDGTPKRENSSGYYFATGGGGGGGGGDGTGGGGTPPAPTYCSQENLSQPAHQPVIFNEIAWMGTTASSNNEWFELKNISDNEVNLSGWQILDKDNEIKIIFTSGDRVSANNFYLLERTDDNSVPNILADKIYTGNLEDNNESLRLFDQNCNLIDELIANPNWPAGDKEEKRSMERDQDLNWHSYFGDTPDPLSGLMATPKGENSAEVGPPQAPQTQKILITEIQIEGDKIDNDFIELYNPNDYDIYLGNYQGSYLRLVKRTATGDSDISIKSWYRDSESKIPARGYYLWASSEDEGYPLSINADTFTKENLALNNGIALRIGSKDTGQIIDAVGWGNFQNVLFEGNSFPENPGKNQSLGRIWYEATQKYKNTGNNSVDFEIQTPTPKNKNQAIEEPGSPFEIVVSGADTVWNLHLTTASADEIDSTDAPPQDLTVAFVSHADSVWSLDFPLLLSDIVDSTDAPFQILSEVYISKSETAYYINLEESF